LQVVPSQANFIFCRVLDRPAIEIKRALESQGILVRTFSKPGMEGLLTHRGGATRSDRCVGGCIAEDGMRTAAVARKTSETEIEVMLDLDGTGRCEIATGVGFLDHMLTHIAVHGLFDLTVRAAGDLEVDPHHTVEDVALCVGTAFDQALDERKGIVRMARPTSRWTRRWVRRSRLSGRPYAVTEMVWTAPSRNDPRDALFPALLRVLCVTAGPMFHARVLYGRDDHHKAEALFKALGRALDAATQVDPPAAARSPSTKGVL
jgi:imidazoleglycerol-phosphate dehydratase